MRRLVTWEHQDGYVLWSLNHPVVLMHWREQAHTFPSEGTLLLRLRASLRYLRSWCQRHRCPCGLLHSGGMKGPQTSESKWTQDCVVPPWTSTRFQAWAGVPTWDPGHTSEDRFPREDPATLRPRCLAKTCLTLCDDTRESISQWPGDTQGSPFLPRHTWDHIPIRTQQPRTTPFGFYLSLYFWMMFVFTVLELSVGIHPL